MKLATLRDGTLDGALVIVSRDLRRALACADIAANLRSALELWPEASRRLAERAATFEDDPAGGFPFDPARAAAPLPRAPQLLDGSAFETHGMLLGKAFGTTMPPGVYAESPLMYQGTSDGLLGPTDDIVLPSEDDGIDFEGEIVVFVAGVAMGSSVAEAAAAIVLVGVMNDVSLRACGRAEIATGFGFVQAKPASSFAPVVVTPDELGGAWHDGRVGLRLHVRWNGEWFGEPTAAEMAVSFPQLVAYAARRRSLGAGTIVGSGTVSNADYHDVGSACIAERRMIEQLDAGAPKTGFMRFGDRVRMELLDAGGASLCGAIDQRIVSLADRRHGRR